MNDLKNNEIMTVKQIASLLQVSNETVKNVIRKVYPAKMISGKKTILNLDESEKIIGEIRIQSKNKLTKNLSVTYKNFVTKDDLKNFAQAIVSETIKSIIPLIQNQNQPRQIEMKQDYYSILGYANYKHIQINFSDAIKFGKEASKLSNSNNFEIRKIPDERFGFVNSYNIAVLEKVFSI